MNFFEHQHRARRKTWILIVYFVLAVALIVAAVNAVIYVAVASATTPPMSLQSWLQRPFWMWASLGVVVMITGGTLFTVLRLRGGGKAVAEMVGARQIDPSTGDFNERQLINVLEEMSIASGTPVPALYVLDDEAAINAFVAGTRPTETVMVVTRGALEHFSRDELQGVVGHEYSHVLNNDMRINIRLMGVLAGILVIGQIGRVMLYSGGRSSGRGSGQTAMIGVALLAIGYIGLFFGALIKAAISRQREFLADASAVQFTRNPDGIAGALYTIKQHADGSLLNNAHSEDLSHFCFGESVHYALSGLMATHPPLEARIKAVDPKFIGRQDRADDAVGTPAVAVAPAGTSGFAGSATFATTLAAVAESVGRVTPEHVRFAQQLHRALPDELVTVLHQQDTVPQAIYALLLAAMNEGARRDGLDLLAVEDGVEAAQASDQLAWQCAELGAHTRLSIINLSLPALKLLGRARRKRFLATTSALIHVDRRFTIFEFSLLNILEQHLEDGAAADPPVKFFKFEPVSDDLRVLLSVLARAGTRDEGQADLAFAHAFGPFAADATAPAETGECTLQRLTSALRRLTQLSPLLKQNVINACADCVIHDGKVTAAEGELLQAIALNLDCPLPPLVEQAG